MPRAKAKTISEAPTATPTPGKSVPSGMTVVNLSEPEVPSKREPKTYTRTGKSGVKFKVTNF